METKTCGATSFFIMCMWAKLNNFLLILYMLRTVKHHDVFQSMLGCCTNQQATISLPIMLFDGSQSCVLN